MLFNEVDTDDEDNEPRMFLSVNAKACARMSDTHTHYEGNTFSYCDFSTHSIPTDENHLWHNLIEIAEDIEDQIRIKHQRFNFTSFGIQPFEFKLVLK